LIAVDPDRRLMPGQCRQHGLLEESPHGHLVLGRIVEDPEADLAAGAVIGQHVGEVSLGRIWLSRSSSFVTHLLMSMMASTGFSVALEGSSRHRDSGGVG
jgi:hypothetical protein